MPVQPARMLGRLPSKPDSRTLRLAKYLMPSLPPPPAFCRWDQGIDDWGVMGNDRYGNCVIVTSAHAILGWRANELDDTKRLSDDQVIDLSRRMGALRGYNILERLNYWRKTGMWGDKIKAFASADPTDPTLIRQTIHLFGMADIGLNMPTAWQDQEIWDTGTGPRFRDGSWGGHSVPLIGYDDRHVYCVTWGQIQAITWPAFHRYCDEAYAVLDPQWTALDGIAPSGFDAATLEADLTAVTS